MILLTLFIVSASIMFILILFRSIELYIGRDIISQKKRDSVDRKLKKFFRTSRIVVKVIKRTIYLEIKKIPVLILHLFISLWTSILRISLKMVSLVQGRGDGHVKGSVSDLLKAAEKFKKYKK